MSISIKTAREIEKMRRAGELLEKVHDELGRAIHPGMSTWEINKLGEEMIRSFGCTPNFLNYNGYPASICVSVNEEVVHGIPSKKRILKEGDIVSLDAGLIYEGYHSDVTVDACQRQTAGVYRYDQLRGGAYGSGKYEARLKGLHTETVVGG